MSTDDMRVDPQRAAALAANLASISQRVQAAGTGSRQVRLIAVSKLKPAADVLALTQLATPQVHFGENYVQELQAKAAALPSAIKWSFIGGLQSNKCAALAQIPNLWAVNSVDSAKKADALERGRAQFLASPACAEAAARWGADADDRRRLRVFVQVNTSGEESKSGVSPGQQAADLCSHVRSLPSLRLQGLMTIGAIAHSQAAAEGGENEDFEVLRAEARRIEGELGLQEGELELSMGMSADFEAAIHAGSAEVRVGSDIFGQRPPRAEANA